MSENREKICLPFSRPVPPPWEFHRQSLPLNDGYATHVYVCHPTAGNLRYPVVYLHGIQSHPGWFSGSTVALSQAGYPVFQPLRRGSGDNAIARGDTPSATQLLSDIETACQWVLRSIGARRVHLVGVSWGGKQAACYALWPKRKIQIASLTLVAPGIVPKVDVGFVTKLRIAASLLLKPRNCFAIPLNDVELFTDNEPMRTYLREDPFRLYQATARFLYASRRLDGMLCHAPKGSLHTPTTLILADRDRIIDNAATEKRLARLTGKKLHTKVLCGCHTLEFEENPKPLYEAMVKALHRGESISAGRAC